MRFILALSAAAMPNQHSKRKTKEKKRGGGEQASRNQ